MLTFKISLKAGKKKNVTSELSFLIEGKKGELEEVNTITKEILKDYQTANVKGLEKLEIFSAILEIISSNREMAFWRKRLKDEKSEESEMPKSQSKLIEFQKLLVIKTLRLDRVTSAITNYIRENMGDKYIESKFDMTATLNEISFWLLAKNYL